MNVLVLRPEPAAAATAERLARMGHDPVLSPVLSIAQTGELPPPGPFGAVLVTSGNAVPAVTQAPSTLKRLPFFAVGERTAGLLRQDGLDVRGEARDARHLAETVKAALSPTSVLHVTARNRKDEPARTLTEAGFDVTAWIAYRATPAERLSDEALRLLRDGQPGAVLHFSTRSARIGRELAARAGLAEVFGRLVHLCLSADVAGALDGLGASTAVAPAADEQSLLTLLERHVSVSRALPSRC